ncbi:MAG: phosphodiester glycosidase family protein [Bacteroidota bacterium]
MMIRIPLFLSIILASSSSVWGQNPDPFSPTTETEGVTELLDTLADPPVVDSCAIQIEALQEEIGVLNDEISVLQEGFNRQVAELDAQQRIIDSLLDLTESIDFKYTKEKAIYPGATAKQVVYRGVNYDVLIIDHPEDIRLYHTDSLGRIGSLGNLKSRVEAAGQQLIFASNAGMFARDFSPQGLYIEEGKKMKPLDRKEKGYGNFYMQPNGVFLLRQDSSAAVIPTKAYPKKDTTIRFATQSGPMLVTNEVINSHFNKPSTNLNIRNGVGVTSDGKVIFVISNQPCNLWSFASLYRDVLKCPNALYLDGAISETYLPAIGRKRLTGPFGPLVGVAKEKTQK